MGYVEATVTFSSAPPTAATLVAALCQHTGELVTYDAECGELACPALREAFGADAPRGEEASWILGTTNLRPTYLWSATLAVLQQLGGVYAYPLPTWAFQPWRLAQDAYQYDMKARGFTLP